MSFSRSEQIPSGLQFLLNPIVMRVYFKYFTKIIVVGGFFWENEQMIYIN